MSCISDLCKKEDGGFRNPDVAFNVKGRSEYANEKDALSEIGRNSSSGEFGSTLSKEERLKALASKFRYTFHNSLLSGHRFHDVFQLKQGRYADIPAATISEMMKPTSLDSAPTLSLLSVVNGILDESVEKKDGEIPHRVACLLRKVVQEIERRISTQAQHLKTQNNVFKVREEKYQSRIRVLEALAEVTGAEPQQNKKIVTEEKIKSDDHEISTLKRELEKAKMTYELQCSKMKTEVKDEYKLEISSLKQQLEIARKTMELQNLQVEAQVRDRYGLEISLMQQELEISKKTNEMKCSQLEIQRKDSKDVEILSLMEELKEMKGKYGMKCLEMETQAKDQHDHQILSTKKDDDEIKCSEMEMRAKDGNDHDFSSLKRELEETKNEYGMKCLEIEKVAKDRYGVEISSLKQDLEDAEEKYKMKCLETETQDNDHYNLEISSLKKELEIVTQAKDQYNIEVSSLKQELDAAKRKYEMKCLEIEKQANDEYNLDISSLKQELQTAKEKYEMQCSEMKIQAMGAEAELKKKFEKKVSELERYLNDSENKVNDHEKQVSKLERDLEDSKKKVIEHEEKVCKLERNLQDARNRVKEIEADAAVKLNISKTKEDIYQGFMNSQFGALKELRSFGGSIKQEVLRSRSSYSEELDRIGPKLQAMARAAEDYHVILAENRKLFNEVQDLKGNIRVFCRVRPFLPGQAGKQTIIERCGDNGELVIVNPSKQAKDGLRSFNFNKVFGPASTQAEVYAETQPFVRSVLDGFNACIFAYGQTGSGKTHTMSGPKAATKEEWGVNFRALDDLFTISQNRRSTIAYEVGVQMVEIYNEQVRDLLSTDASQKKIGIVTNSQASGLAVPDATLKNVNSTSDVVVLMDAGLKNRSVSSTAMNERSSRSHSIISIHVRGTDVKTGGTLRGSLHLVDLAGSERIDRSEVTGDRLKEAQHINKSLAALGDVIFALSQKSNHVPYRNSKLTQLLQSSLGGQAKTLMFVQVNPDSVSYSETLSTLKFAERVSGVELGAAKSSKDSKGEVKELMDQLASLKDTISKKDEEIEQLRVLKDLKNVHSAANGERRGARLA